jgi:hypothetical protein
MPMLKFDIVECRTDKEIQTMLDAAHRAVLTAFRDCFKNTDSYV